MKDNMYQGNIKNNYHLGKAGNWAKNHKFDITVVTTAITALTCLALSDISCPSYIKTSDAEKVLSNISEQYTQADRQGKIITLNQAQKGINLEKVLNK